MTAKELMIGDLVRCSDPTPFRVQGIYNDDPWMVEDEQGLKVCLGDVEPIPLTEDILVKNGFEKVTIDFVIYTDKHELWINYCDGIFDISIMESYVTINYVHELQHALRLCGLTELADNFKVEGGAE